MKKNKILRCIQLLVLLTSILAATLLTSSCSKKDKLYVFNWGDYIGEDVIEDFEKQYPDIDVVYEMFDTNEAMYQKLVSSNIAYDVLIPSDYMIERLIAEDRLKKIDISKITNYSKISSTVKNASFDPNNEYSVPYTWGTLGILYNKTKVDETVDSWNILWNEKYSGQILMLDSMRDTMAVALIKCGYDINTKTESEIMAARDALLAQKPIVAEYGVDKLKSMMIEGNYALSLAWSGDAIWMIQENEDLDYALPKEGSNIFIDSMVIPTTSKNTEAAHLFIDFMCSTDIAYRNADYIGYSTPQTEALDKLDDYLKNSPIYNPSAEMTANCKYFSYLGDTVDVYNSAWETLRLSTDTEELSLTKIILIVLAAIIAVGVVIFFILRKRKLDKIKYSD